jgi:glycosyltransferase involved in cell wall biosynthesis
MKKNILILGHNDATQFVDIYNQYTRIFDKSEYTVTVAYLSGNESEQTKKRTLADQVIFLKTPKKTMRGLKLNVIRDLLTLCKEKQFEIVICHRYKPTYVMMWVAQFCKIQKLYFVMHELGTMSSLKRKLLISFLYRQNMIFAGVSNAVRDDMRKQLWSVPKEKIITLYNVIDAELTEPDFLSKEEARAQLSLNQDDYIYGNIARLAINKDQKNLLTAFAAIKSHCPKTKCVIMGNGELESELKALAKSLGIENDVLFLGFVPSAFRYLRAFDCFVLSSIQEAFGRVLIEAMLAKLPVIATEVNGIPEVLGQSGVKIKARDSNALSHAMKSVYLLAKDEREKMGEIAYQEVMMNFSIPAFHKQFWQSYGL